MTRAPHPFTVLILLALLSVPAQLRSGRVLAQTTWSKPGVELELEVAEQIGSLEGVDETVLDAQLEFTFDGLLTERWQARVRTRIRDDDDGMTDAERWRLVDDGGRRAAGSLAEATLTRYGDRWQLRLGIGEQRWGTGDLYRPSDDVDARDFLEASEAEEVGTWHLVVTRQGARGEAQFLWWPGFVAHRLPTVGDRWFPDLQRVAGELASALALPAGEQPILLRPLEPAQTVESSTFGLKLASSTLVGGWDLAFTALRGHDRFGVLSLVPPDEALLVPPALGPAPPSGPVPLGVQRSHPRFTELAGTFSTTAGAFEWHGELTHRLTEGAADDDYLQGLLGLTYTLDHHLPSWIYNAIFVLEGAYEETTAEASASGVVPVSFARPFTETAMGALRLELPGDGRLEVGGVYNLSGGDRSWRVEWRRSLRDHWTATARVEVFDGAPDTFFGAWRDLDRAVLSLAWRR